MRQIIPFLLVFCITAATSSAQIDTVVAKIDTSAKAVNIQMDTATTCKVGTLAPPLRVKEWIKGAPVTNLQKGKVYVIEFWATWCGPCMRAMPHLSELARKYRGKITFLAIDVWEQHGNFPKTIQKVKTFVDLQGRKMDFSVATEDTSYTNNDWLRAYGRNSIPTTFVVDGQGTVAWYGHPTKIDTVLAKVLDNTWDVKGDLAKKIRDHYLDSLDYTVIAKVDRFRPKFVGRNYLGFPDSALMVIDDMVKKEPRLKYAPYVGQYTFAALLLIDPHKANEFGRRAMISAFPYDAYRGIIFDIQDDAQHLTPPKEIYLLGAECYQGKIDTYPNLPADEMAKQYQAMSEWYRAAGEKSKAIAAEKMAITFWEKDYKNKLTRVKK